MSLVEYCAYLKREIFMLKAQVKKLKTDLAEALAQQNLYEPLLQEPEPEPVKPAPEEPTAPTSYWQWLKFRKG